MEQLFELAKDLGHELQKDPRFIRLQMAQAAADEDELLQELIGAFNLKRMALAAESGKPQEEQDHEKLMQLQADLQESYARVMATESMQAYQAAKVQVDEIVNGIGTIINMAAQGMNPDDFDQHQCGGDCGSCGGCH